MRYSLAQVDLFNNIDENVILKFDANCSWRKYNAGKIILDHENQSYGVYFIVEGVVRVVNYSRSGREVSFGEIYAPDFFGELPAIDGEPRSASVIALEDSIIGILPAKAFRQILTSYPFLSFRMLQRLSKIIRRSNDKIMDLSTLNANNRVYAEILKIAETAPDADDNGTILIKNMPTHGEIGARIGTTRETVSRVMSNLQRQSVIRKTKQGWEILDYDRLVDMLEEI